MKDKIAQLRDGLILALKSGKIDIVYGKALIIDNTTIVCNEQEYNASNILICTGSKPRKPFRNAENVVTSDGLLNIKKMPESLLVLGGGVVAVEFANSFAELGSEVTICIRGDRILRGWDKEIAIGLTQQLKRKGIKIINKCSQDEMSMIQADVILSALGREPNLDIESVRRLNIKTDEGIVVDDNGMTSIPNVYAAGDIISNSTQLAHVAMYQGERAVQAMFSKDKSVKIPAVTKCIYVGLEVASLGYTSEEAKEAGINVISAKQVMGSNARTLILDGDRGFIKVIADADKDVLVGAHLMCERAGDIVSELSLAINEETKIDELIRNVRPHPSFCEEITGALKALKTKR